MSNINYAWEAVDRPAGNAWPNADVGGDNIGIVNDFNNNIMRLYYTSGGRMVEANGDNGNWQAATVLATSNSSQVADNPAANSTSTPAADGGQSGLSDGAKAGISVGVTVGVIAVGGMLFAFWFLRRRQRKLDAAAAAAAAGGSGASNGGDQQYMSPSSGYTVPTNHTVDGYPPQMAQVQGAYTPLQQGGYAQQQQPGYAYGHAVSADGAYAQPVPQHGYPAQDGGGWAYGTPSEGGQQGYFYPQQQQHQHQQQQQQYPQELADQPRPVELIGEGHYKEIP